MNPLAEQHLKERLFEEVATMLTEGDLDYLRSLSHTALGEVIENELRFLGLYEYGDQEAPRLIHTLVQQHLDQWRTEYLSANIHPFSRTT